MNDNQLIGQRFRGFLPVVIDVETAGFDPKRNALLEIAAVLLRVDENGQWLRGETHACHVHPFDGAILERASLEFTGIDPYHPFRLAVSELEALQIIFKPIRAAVKAHHCTRAILVGHNSFFDLGFINAAIARTRFKHSPLHQFSTFDTVSLAGLTFGQTVLARSVQAAGLAWDNSQAHSAIYDAERTADLFCAIVNLWEQRGGLPPMPAFDDNDE